MSETKHTPGEWTYQHDADGDFAIFGGNRLMAVTAADTPEDEANAKLFAAAPGMLAALKVAQHSLRAWNAMGMSGDVGKQVAAAYENSPEMKVIAAAIAKAGTQ